MYCTPKCSICGKFISYEDINNGLAIIDCRETLREAWVGGDIDFIEEEINHNLCKKCNQI